MLPPSAMSMPSSTNGVSSASVSLRATSSPSVGVFSPASAIPNSSPPSRATVSLARKAPVQPRPHLPEQLVAALVSEGVVHLFEAMQIEEQDADAGPLPARGGDRLRDAVEEQQPVRQLREVIEHREATVLVGAPGELVAVAADPSRRADHDPEQHRPQQDEAAREHEQQPPGVRADLVGDRRPRHVDLEGADVLLAELDRDVDLEQLPELALVDVLGLVEVADIRGELAVEALLQVVLDREPLTDQLVLIRVEDLAVG